jgi:raffinose/stachyose/melibiose transport system permease protein
VNSQSTSRARLAILTVAALPFLYPFYFLLCTALRPEADFLQNPLGLPTHLTTTSLRTAWDQATIFQSTINSLIAVGTSVVVLLVVSALAAHWFLLHRSRMASMVLATICALWVLPYVIYVIPLFVELHRLGLINRLWVLGFVYAALNVPFAVGFLYAYLLRGVPPEILEAARIDGASDRQLFVSLVLPLARPALAAVAALSFVWSWGDLLVSLILVQTPQDYTLTVSTATLVTQFDNHPQEVAAAALMSILPVFIVFLVAQRYIRRGMTAGVDR